MSNTRPSSKPLRTMEPQMQDNAIDGVEVSSLNKLSPLVVFAHGAGSPSTSDWMIRWKEMLGKALHAVEVVTFDYPYMAGKKRGVPPKLEKLIDFHADVVGKAIPKYPSHPLILAAKSMGSRVSCMVANQEDISASAIVCLGYPLKGRKGTIRDDVLVQLTFPVIFVQGSKDRLCPLDKLEAVIKMIKPLCKLHKIEAGDHSFKIAKKHLQETGTTQDDAEESAVWSIASFISNNLCESQ